MSRTLDRLSALQVRSLDRLGVGKHHDGGGLYLAIREGVDGLTASWLLRYERGGETKWMGLGSSRDLSLADARKRRKEERRRLAEGQDPLTEKRARKAKPTTVPTFRQATKDFLKGQRHAWRSTRHARNWEQALEKHVHPVIGSLPVDRIDTADVLRVLEPVWFVAAETGSRLRGRIEQVLDFATVHEHRHGLNPARWRGHLDKLLPAKSKVHRVTHRPALSYADLPDLYARLVNEPGHAALALRWAILTACRPGEAAGAKWLEIDSEAATWVLAPERMKGGREHRVALAKAATAVLKAARTPDEAEPYLFPSAPGKPLYAPAMTKVLRRLGVTEASTHGMRSAFRDWAAETTNFPREIAELCLAHQVGSEVERAYARSDLLEKRRLLMAQWATFVTTPKSSAKVTTMRSRRHA